MDRPAVADYPPGAHTPVRVIDDHELVWMLRGRARLGTEDRDLDVSPGELLLVPPGVPHSFTWDPARPSRHGYVHFAAGRVAPHLPGEIRLRPMTSHDPLAGLCAYLLWLGHEHTDDWRPRAHATLGFLLEVFAAGPLPDAEAPRALPGPLVAAVARLRHEWAQPPLRRVGVVELARAALVSRAHLNGLFRATFGHGPARAMERARCSRAETLLVRTDLTVETVARQCGFADLSHFSHRFTALHGVPPSTYRAAGGRAPSLLDDPGVRRLALLVWP